MAEDTGSYVASKDYGDVDIDARIRKIFERKPEIPGIQEYVKEHLHAQEFYPLLFFSDTIDIYSGQEGIVAVKNEALGIDSQVYDFALGLVDKPVQKPGYYSIPWLSFDGRTEEECAGFVMERLLDTGFCRYLLNIPSAGTPALMTIIPDSTFENQMTVSSSGYQNTSLERLRADSENGRKIAEEFMTFQKHLNL